MRRQSLLALASALLIPGAVEAGSVLTFDGLGLNNYDPIPATYGDNLAGTPNVTVDYKTFNGEDYLEFWVSGYDGLTNVGYPAANGYMAEVALTAASGYTVKLNSFDLGGYPGTDRLDQTVRILDGDGIILVDYSPFDVEGNSGHSSLSPNLVSSAGGTLRIQFGLDWNVGIDNISFEEARVIPLPSAAALFPVGAALVGLCHRRRQWRA